MSLDIEHGECKVKSVNGDQVELLVRESEQYDLGFQAGNSHKQA